jgi:GlpG protein
MQADTFTALELPLDTDLALFSSLLYQRGIPHRVTERAGRLVLEVFEPSLIAPVRAAYEALARGDYVIERREPNVPQLQQAARSPAQRIWRQLPVTAVLLALSVLGFALVELDSAGILWHWLTFQNFQPLAEGRHAVGIDFDPVKDSLARGEYWRLVTPVFLHFGWLHIVFNGLWLWDLARRIELRVGHWHLFFIVNAIAVGSNLAQYVAKKDIIFGGMSGVIYGLLGYCWVWDKLLPSRAFMLPPGIAGFMVGWLVFCYLGLTQIFGIYVANEAHLSGLILGLVIGFASALLARFALRR